MSLHVGVKADVRLTNLVSAVFLDILPSRPDKI